MTSCTRGVVKTSGAFSRSNRDRPTHSRAQATPLPGAVIRLQCWIGNYLFRSRRLEAGHLLARFIGLHRLRSSLNLMDTRRVSEEQAIALLREWQKEFRLQDWNLQLAVRRKCELPRHGDVNLVEEKKCAFIRVLHAEDADPKEMEPLDMEMTVIHESIHVALAPFLIANEHLDIVQEQAIHTLSQAFVRLKRELRDLRAQNARRTAKVYARDNKPTPNRS